MPLITSQGSGKKKAQPVEAFAHEADVVGAIAIERRLSCYERSTSAHQPLSDPLVEGMRSFWRGSISIASRSARASALKQLSAMW